MEKRDTFRAVVLIPAYKPDERRRRAVCPDL